MMVWIRRSGENRSLSQRVDSGESRNDGVDPSLRRKPESVAARRFRLSPE